MVDNSRLFPKRKAMERGAIQVKRNNDTGKEMWRPMPRKDLMNRSDAEIEMCIRDSPSGCRKLSSSCWRHGRKSARETKNDERSRL